MCLHADLRSTSPCNRCFRFPKHICDESHKAWLVKRERYLHWHTASSLCSSWPIGELLSLDGLLKSYLNRRHSENTKKWHRRQQLHKIILPANEESVYAITWEQKNVPALFSCSYPHDGLVHGENCRSPDSRLQTAQIWPLNKNLCCRMSDTWPSQAEEHSHPFYTWKASNKLSRTTKPITKNFIPAQRCETGRFLPSSSGWARTKVPNVLQTKALSDRHPCR